MRIGIGLPVAVTERPAGETASWAAESEQAGFSSVGSIDRLVYDNLEPIVALTAAAAVTERVELVTAILNIGWRNNSVLLAKQLGTLDAVSGGRLLAGIGLGAWPDDYAYSGLAQKGLGKVFDAALDTMRQAWSGEITSVSGPMTPMPEGRPRILIGGIAPAAYARAARVGEGWVAPSFGRDTLVAGVEGVGAEWAKAGRAGAPRIITERYVSLGPTAHEDMTRYVKTYYGSAADAYFDAIMNDAPTTEERLAAELTGLAEAGVDDVLLFPATADRDQIGLIADALERIGAKQDGRFALPAPATAA